MITPPTLKPSTWPLALMAAIMAAIAVYALLGWLLWHPLPGFPLPATISFGYSLRGAISGHFAPGTEIGAWWVASMHMLGEHAYLLTWRLKAPAIPALIVGGLVFAKVLALAPADSLIHVRGRRLLRDGAARQAFLAMSKAECRNSGAGVRPHPSFPALSIDRETRSFLVMGSVGGGKTQIIMPLLLAAQGRGDRILVFDNKSDFSAKLPGNPLIFGPWDNRSLVWDVAADCGTKQDAKELAARLVQESKDPMWSNAARQVLAALIIHLQREQPQRWGWRDLANLIPLPQSDLKAIIHAAHPEALRAIEDPGKTTQSILISLSSYCGVVFDLAAAWGDVPSKRRFSFVRWVTESGKEKSAKTIILQGNGKYNELTRAYVGGILSALSSIVNSPQVGESRARKVWLFLDEFPQLGKIPNFAPFLEVGRSKGIRVVIGAQDINQLREHYGKQADAWMAMMGTHIYARLSAGETADFVSKLVGNREVERANISVSGGRGGKNQSVGFGRDTMPVIMPSQLQSELGPAEDGSGVDALMLAKDNALILRWPYTKLQGLRPASKPAGWTIPVPAPETEEVRDSAPADPATPAEVAEGDLLQEVGAMPQGDDQPSASKKRLRLRVKPAAPAAGDAP